MATFRKFFTRKMRYEPFVPSAIVVPALVAHVGQALGPSGGNTSASPINTSGANLIVACITWFPLSTPILSDSNGNTWTQLSTQSSGGNNDSCLYYCYAPIVGTGHYFIVSGGSIYCSVIVAAFSGAVASPFDQQNGSSLTLGSATIQPGSITPAANTIIVTALGYNGGGGTPEPVSVDSSFTITDAVAYGSANNEGGALAWKYITTSLVQNPTWTTQVSLANMTATIASFKY